MGPNWSHLFFHGLLAQTHIICARHARCKRSLFTSSVLVQSCSRRPLSGLTPIHRGLSIVTGAARTAGRTQFGRQGHLGGALS